MIYRHPPLDEQGCYAEAGVEKVLRSLSIEVTVSIPWDGPYSEHCTEVGTRKHFHIARLVM
jgi:hypothetical protein